MKSIAAFLALIATASLSLAHQQVAAVMLEDPEFALHASVDVLARRAKVSPPTITRFCRTLGCAGLLNVYRTRFLGR